MKISPNNQVIIMDEAHNIEDSARDAGSYSMTEESLANTTADLLYLIKDEVKLDDHRPLHLLCTKLGQWITEHARNLKSSDYETSSDVWCGRDIIEHLREWGITQDTLPLLVNNFSSAMDASEEGIENTKMLHSSSQATLGGLFNVLRYLMLDDYKYCDDYRITIIRQAVFSVPPPKRTRDGWVSLNKKSKKHFVTSLNFWCLNPAVAFNDLKQAHCIILTSGTLSPMSSFSSELGLSFPIQLEANHVIQESQVWVGALGKGPKGVQLEATYRNTDRFDFQDELGDLVHDVCNTIPHGVLCFFSSYGMMKKMQDRWKGTGLWHKLEGAKQVICEPRSSNKEEFASLLNLFYDAIQQSENEGSEQGGALMFAVCRGKVSEGLDFADNNARAVITVGIPFPSIKDKQVELKRQYNDIHKSQRGLLSGGQWYEIQAYRAINQALGRCIRHKNDWGALLIVDDRFCRSPQRYSKGLSKWVRQKMIPYPNYDSFMPNLKAFVQKWTTCNDPERSTFPMQKCSTSNGLSRTANLTVDEANINHRMNRLFQIDDWSESLAAHSTAIPEFTSTTKKETLGCKKPTDKLKIGVNNLVEKNNEPAIAQDISTTASKINTSCHRDLKVATAMPSLSKPESSTARSDSPCLLSATINLEESTKKTPEMNKTEGHPLAEKKTEQICVNGNERTSDDDFQLTNTISSAQKSKRRSSKGKSRKKNFEENVPKSEIGNLLDESIFDMEVDFLNDTIAPTPEKVTEIPESPSSASKFICGDKVAHRTADKAKQMLNFNSTFEGCKISTRTRIRSLPENVKVEANDKIFKSTSTSGDQQPKQETLCTSEKDSGELLPRHQRKRKLSHKKHGSLLLCRNCNNMFHKHKTTIRSKTIKSHFLSTRISRNDEESTRHGTVQAYCMPARNVTAHGSLKVLEATDLNSHWCEEEEKCYRLYSCSNCSNPLAFQILSEPAMKSKLIIPNALVHVDEDG